MIVKRLPVIAEGFLVIAKRLVMLVESIHYGFGVMGFIGLGLTQRRSPVMVSLAA